VALTVSPDAQDFLGSTYGITPNQAVVDMRDDLAQLEPDTSPWMTLLMHPDFSGRAARSVKVEWLEMESLPITTTTDSDDSGTGTQTTIVCSAGTGVYFRPQDYVRIETTGELVYVSARSVDTLTVVRGIGNGGTGVDWGTTNGISLVRIGNASTQAGSLPEIRMVNSTAQFNYTWIERTPYGMSRSAVGTRQYGGDPMANARAAAGAYHKRAQEETYFWGKRDIRQTNSRPQTFAGGLAYFITANITTVGGNLTAANLETYSRDWFRYGSHRKFLFCAPIITSAFSFFGLAKTQLTTWEEGEKRYGIKASKFVNGAGDELIIVNKRNWKERLLTSPGGGGTGFIVDMDVVARRPFQNADSIHIENRQAPDYDGKKNEFLTESSLEVCNGGSGGSGNGRHGIIRGITGYA
jgi:hypothetical protein